MKKITLLFPLFFIVNLNNVLAQDIWNQKADFGGTERYWAVAFSIDAKGYLGTGATCCDGNRKDFWEYDPALNTWTQKADFGGTARYGAIGFSIGGKGYIGTGYDGTLTKDFWEYDPASNTWTQEADFGGAARAGAVGFSIGNKGYIGTGQASNGYLNDFWRYDPDINKWTKKKAYGGSKRAYPVGFAIDGKGYIGTGFAEISNEFWEYDPILNTWNKKADFSGSPRNYAAGFSIGGFGYIGTGNNNGISENDFWEYNPVSNNWTQKTNLSAAPRFAAVGFSIGSKGYLGTGISIDAFENDLWEYSPTACNGITVYADLDGDDHGDISNPYFAADCVIPSGYVTDSSDCNDTDVAVFPGATEIANGIDDNCNGIIDEGLCNAPIGLSTISITQTDATFSWDTYAGAISYKLRYKVASSEIWTKLGTTSTSKTISGLTANTKYVWQVRSECAKNPTTKSEWSGKQHFTTTPLRIASGSAIPSFEIYPNPLSNSATISFSLPEATRATIELYDVTGRKLQTILDKNLSAGNQEVIFQRGQWSSGLYLLQVRMGDRLDVKKLVVE